MLRPLQKPSALVPWGWWDSMAVGRVRRWRCSRSGEEPTNVVPWNLHPGRLTWNIIMEVWKMIFLSKWVICRFRVNLPGCTVSWNTSPINLGCDVYSFAIKWSAVLRQRRDVCHKALGFFPLKNEEVKVMGCKWHAFFCWEDWSWYKWFPKAKNTRVFHWWLKVSRYQKNNL